MKSPVLSAPAIDVQAQRASSRSVLDSVVLYGVVSLLLFGPLAAGAVRPWSTFVLEIGAGLLFGLWLVRQAALGMVEVTSNSLFPPMLVFAALNSPEYGLCSIQEGRSTGKLWRRTAGAWRKGVL